METKRPPHEKIIRKMAEEKARRHIEKLRKEKFSIGSGTQNPLTQDLHHAVTCLSMELYSKDVHFLMELIQNAEDNEYADNVEPTLEFALTTKDITGCGTQETLLVFNNEVGFSPQNMESICSVGRSTKKGKRSKGFIGEKGIGFKSVFLVSKLPHIVSNGYKVKFSEEHDKDCGIGYIVPQWISDDSFVSKIQDVYGSVNLPMTIIILPLKADKVSAVKKELSSLHPEILLFLSKLKRLHVHENNGGLKKADSVTAISIVSETNHVLSRDKAADSRVIHLSVKENPDSPEETCQYYLWRQAFPVKAQAKVSGRADVEQWILSLAFPFGKRLKRGTTLVGIFAFLPTSMVTNFPFVIQADFILASSRESIVFDNTWNQGILECVPLAFVDAFTSCVRQGSPLFSVAQAFDFLPSRYSPFPEFNKCRETIRQKLSDSWILPCDMCSSQLEFFKPSSAVRIHPSFREILMKLKKTRMSFVGIYAMKKYPVHSSLDKDKHSPSLDFLGIRHENEWYEKFLTSCKIVAQASDDIYIDLLYFISLYIPCYTPGSWPILKFTCKDGRTKICSLQEKSRKYLDFQYFQDPELHAWMQKCNIKFGCPNRIYLLPNSIQVALTKHVKGESVFHWLSSYASVKSCSPFEYSSKLCDYMSHEGKSNEMVLLLSHFLYHCKLNKSLTDSEMSSLSRKMPVIDGSGSIRVQRTETLVPSSGSKWAKLLGPRNPLTQENYVDISECYARNGEFAGELTPGNVLINFLKLHSGARDLPEISLPNVPLQVSASEMTSEQAFLLLDWIRFHRTKGEYIPERFVESIRSGKWVKTRNGADCPRSCIVPSESGKAILELVKDVLSGVSIVDEDFYGDQVSSYIDELKFLGVQCGISGVQNFVMDRFKVLASSPMKREVVLPLLLFIGFLKERKMLDEQWLIFLRHAKWLKTYKCYAAPKDTIYFDSDSDADAAQLITSLQVVDGNFYGSKLHSFFDELKLLGVKSEMEVYSLVGENLSFPGNPSSLTSDCGFLILKCIRNIKSLSQPFMDKILSYPWLKTSMGFKSPSAVILHKQEWDCLLNVVPVPLIDEDFYGNEIRLYIDELKGMGVAVEIIDALPIVLNEFKSQLLLPMASGHLIKLLHCIKELKKTKQPSVLDEVCEIFRKDEILRTRHGYKKLKESILFNSKWASISFFVDLPLVDDSYYGIEIYGLRDEMKILGVLSNLEEGAIFVARGLTKPIERGLLTAEGTKMLLECLQILMADENENPLLEPFIENMSKSEILMTSYGYKLPKDCILFQAAWKEMLELSDAAFIDDKYYGIDMSTFILPLTKVGVKVDLEEVCRALYQSLPSFSETPPIKRIYCFLKNLHWFAVPPDSTHLQVWIPSTFSSSEGLWVNSTDCVLHDKTHYFSSILYSLDTFYDKELLPFFNTAFQVIECPSTSHFLQIWGIWESKETSSISESECCFFWGHILQNWNQEMEESLKKKLVKVPALLPNGSILLVSKKDVMIPDDLWLKNMFLDFEDPPLFAWLPTIVYSAVPPSRLCTVYNALGVRKISECMKSQVKIMPLLNQTCEDGLKKKLIQNGLIRIILGFLACKMHMPRKERHQAVNSLLGISVLGCDENVRVSYKLMFGNEKCLEREVVKLVHWDRKSQRLFIDGTVSDYQKASVEFVTFFAAEIAERIIPNERVSVVNSLRNLIQMGFMFEFQEHSVQSLLTRENIEVLVEDEEFIAAAFPEGSNAPTPVKRARTSQTSLAPLTPIVSQHAKKRKIDGNDGKSKFNIEQVVRKLTVEEAEVHNPTKPKKPLTSFFAFMEKFRTQYKLEHPHICSASDVSRAAAEKWRAMSDLEKAPYIELTEKRKAEYEMELNNYYRIMDARKDSLSNSSEEAGSKLE